MSSSPKQQMKDIMLKAAFDFDNGINTNGEKIAVDFFISELSNKNRSDVMYIRPSQYYGVRKLLIEKVPDIEIKRNMDCEPFVIGGQVIDEGQMILHISWEGPFPGTSEIPACCSSS